MVAPDYNWCVQTISPSPVIPYGGFSDWKGASLSICYNSYSRDVFYKSDNRHGVINYLHNRKLNSPHIWEKLNIKEEFFVCEIQDDWSSDYGASEFLALNSFLNKEIREEDVLKYSYSPREFGSSLRGGINIINKMDYGWNFTPLSPDIVQKFGEYFIMLAKEDDDLTFIADNSLSVGSNSENIYLSEIVNDIINKLKIGDFKAAGLAGDIYWAKAYKNFDIRPSPFNKSYLDARISGALLGFPIGKLLGLLVAPENKNKVIKCFPEWKLLPYGITPFGARICGKW